jgi:hypothetical protein
VCVGCHRPHEQGYRKTYLSQAEMGEVVIEFRSLAVI